LVELRRVSVAPSGDAGQAQVRWVSARAPPLTGAAALSPGLWAHRSTALHWALALRAD
jgi:hypothetical protein